jgi:serine/threonine-protein kinase RsbW
MGYKEEFLKLTLLNDISYLPIARTCVRETAKKYGFDGDDLYKIELALEEAVSNVTEHAFEAEEDSTFDIICKRIPAGIEIIIKEKGLPFDPGQMPQYNPDAGIEERSASGLGIYLLRESVDEVSYLNLGPEGKETHIKKYIPGGSIKEYFPELELQAAPESRTKDQAVTEKIPFDVRRMEPREAIEISQGAYKSHGYTFFDEHIYYPEQIVEMNKSGELISAVAVTKENTFMGHAALLYPRPDSTIAELTFVFVNPEYRGQGCLNRLSEFLFNEARELNLAGIYSYAVANHPFTQKTMLKYGINDCGIELGTSPPSWIFKGIEGNASQRISVVLSFKYLKGPEPLTLYPPPGHREMIKRLYRNIGAEHHCLEPAAAPLYSRGFSVIETVVHAAEGSAEIFVRTAGNDLVKKVKGILRDLCLKQIASITLLQSLEDTAAYFLTPDFEALGFFFSGILPHTDIGDALILQYLNNVSFDYEKVVAYSDTAKEMLEYIRGRDPNQDE